MSKAKRIIAFAVALTLMVNSFAINAFAATSISEGSVLDLKAKTSEQKYNNSYYYNQDTTESYNPYAGNSDVWNSLTKLDKGYFLDKAYDKETISTENPLEWVEVTTYKLTPQEVRELITVNGTNAGDLLVDKTPSISNKSDYKYTLHKGFAESTVGKDFIKQNTIDGVLNHRVIALINAIVEKLGLGYLTHIIDYLITIGQGENLYNKWAEDKNINIKVNDVNNPHEDFPFTYNPETKTYTVTKTIYNVEPVKVRVDLVNGGLWDFEYSNDRYIFIEKLLELFEAAGIEYLDVALITDYTVTEAYLGKVISSVPQNNFKWTVVNKANPSDVTVKYSMSPNYSFMFTEAGEYHIECENLMKNTLVDEAKVQYVSYSVLTDTNNIIDAGHNLTGKSATTIRTNERTEEEYVLLDENKWDIEVTPNMVGKKFSYTSNGVTNGYDTERIE